MCVYSLSSTFHTAQRRTSIHSVKPNLRTVAYHSTKSGVLQLGRSLACELARERIRVNTVSPGYIKTRCLRCFPTKYLSSRTDFIISGFAMHLTSVPSSWSSRRLRIRLGVSDVLTKCAGSCRGLPVTRALSALGASASSHFSPFGR